jgi:hypothetical protein
MNSRIDEILPSWTQEADPSKTSISSSPSFAEHGSISSTRPSSSFALPNFSSYQDDSVDLEANYRQSNRESTGLNAPLLSTDNRRSDNHSRNTNYSLRDTETGGNRSTNDSVGRGRVTSAEVYLENFFLEVEVIKEGITRLIEGTELILSIKDRELCKFGRCSLSHLLSHLPSLSYPPSPSPPNPPQNNNHNSHNRPTRFLPNKAPPQW